MQLLLLALSLSAILAAPAKPEVTIAPYAYSDEFARSKILVMCAATDNSQPLKCLKNHFQQPELRKRYDVACDKYKIDRCVAYSAVDHFDKVIMLAFRGTVGNFQYDLEIVETGFGNRTFWVGGGRVSEYFANGFMAIWDGGMKNDFNYLKNKYPDYQVWIAGHSLGGSMASLAASYLAALKLTDPTTMRLVTIGQPRTGDQDFALAHDKMVPYSYRVIHAHDIIPHMPMQYWEQYHHHKTEVWYNNNMTAGDPYKICEAEDSLLCSDGVKDTSFADHSVYFNVDVGSWGAKGCPPL